MEDLRLKVGYLKGGSKKSLRDGLKGGLRGDLPPQNPFPLASPASNFFSLYIAPSPEASGKSLYMWPGLASLAPTTYTKSCPAYATPFVPTLLKTASPERLLRPPLASSPASNFFSLYNAPSRRPQGNSLYMWPRPPLASPLLHTFFPFTPSPLRRPRASLTAKQAPATKTKTCPAYATPFVPTLLKTPSPERLLRPPPPSLPPASNSFSLYSPLSGGLGQVFVYVAGARFARPNHIYKNLPACIFPLKHPFESPPSNPPWSPAP